MKNHTILILLLILIIDVITEEGTNNNEFGIKFGNSVPRNLQNLNVIKVTFNTRVKYLNGFSFPINGTRNCIEKIKLGNDTLGPEDTLIIPENATIEIYFNEPVQSLYKFFYYNKKDGDGNVRYISSIDLSNFDSSKVTQIDYLFCGCIMLEEINFTNFTTAGVQNLSYVFHNCRLIKEVNLSNFKINNPKVLNCLFKYCYALEIIDFGGANYSNVQSATFMFKNISNLKYIYLCGIQNMNKVFKSEIDKKKKKV